MNASWTFLLLLVCLLGSTGCVGPRSEPDPLAPYTLPQHGTVYAQVTDARPQWERVAPKGENQPVQTQDGVNPDRVRIVFLQEFGTTLTKQNIATRVLALFPDQDLPDDARVFRVKLISWVGIGKAPPNDDAVEGRCSFSVEVHDGAGWTFLGLYDGNAFTEIEGEDVDLSLLNLLTAKAADGALLEFWAEYKARYPPK